MPRPEALALAGAAVAFVFVARSISEAQIHGAGAAAPCGLVCWLSITGIATVTVGLFTLVARTLR